MHGKGVFVWKQKSCRYEGEVLSPAGPFFQLIVLDFFVHACLAAPCI